MKVNIVQMTIPVHFFSMNFNFSPKDSERTYDSNVTITLTGNGGLISQFRTEATTTKGITTVICNVTHVFDLQYSIEVDLSILKL